MGDVGQLAEPGPKTSKDPEGPGKLRMRDVMLNVTATTNATFDGEMLPIGENQNMTFMNATCNLECSRLDCTHFTASTKTDNCLCHKCDLEVGKSSTEQDSGGNRDKRQSSFNCWDRRYRRLCRYKRVLRSRITSRHVCVWIPWYGYYCYYRYYIIYYYVLECDCSGNIVTTKCGGNAGSTSSLDFGCPNTPNS
jgi:hypothetical protein